MTPNPKATVIAKIMDITFVKPWFREFKITKTKRFLVYDPNKVTPRHYQKKVNDD